MMKQKVINASYRKNSNSFPEWMKYEVELLNEDGSTEKIPAYGKDLQDALSRVVHDSKVEKLEKRTKRIPDLVWVILWFGYILGWTMLTYAISPYNKLNGIFFVCGIGLITLITLLGKSWFRKRNKDK
jgi:sulfite exporter TauE/SafE